MKKKERIEISRGEAARLAMDMLEARIEQLEWEMAHLRKNRRNARRVLMRAEKAENAKKRK